MATFALIPGAHHNAWCWERLIPELRARGHDAVAPVFPIEDPKAGVSRYADVMVEALQGRDDDDIVIVGHSLGGLTVPVVAARRPVRRMVFLAAVIPEPGKSSAEQTAADPPPGLAYESKAIDNGDGTRTRTPEEAIERYYHDCTDEQRRFALAHLSRQSYAPSREPSPLRSWPDVPASYIVCADDRALRPERCRELARRRLGVEPIEINSSHSPMLSRPAELADILVSLP